MITLSTAATNDEWMSEKDLEYWLKIIIRLVKINDPIWTTEITEEDIKAGRVLNSDF